MTIDTTNSTSSSPLASASPASSSSLAIPEPSFDAMSLSADLRRAISELGYEKPTPVQWAVWESASAGRDVVVQARTGTGKTAAFGMPLIDKVVKKSQAHPQALILCPTRELALQVARELEQLGAHKEVRTLAIYGGAPMQKQISDLKAGPHIIAGTPGRVLDHLHRGTLDGRLIATLVLDEADEMLSMGFERELHAIIERLQEDRMTWLFSATIPPSIERMARTKLKKPEFVILSGDQVGALSLQHFVYIVTDDKYRTFTHLIDVEDPASAIVFCNTREQTQRLAQWLQRDGFEADWLMGDLAQSDREKVMRKTREGKLRFLVATDVAARGIDISHLTHVINYDFPQDAESYVHRTGRTGRAGRTGTAISLVAPHDMGALYLLRLTYKIRPLERRVPSDRELRTRIETDTVTAMAETFAPRGQSPEHLALARRLLSRDDAEQVLAGILHEHLSANSELPEVAQARRRGSLPPPMPEPVAEPLAEPMPSTPRVAREPARSPRVTAPLSREVVLAEHAVVRLPDADTSLAVELVSADESSRRRRRSTRPEPSLDTAPRMDAIALGTEPAISPVREPSGDGVREPSSDGVRELRIEVGRREGVRERDLKTLLADGGIHAEQVRDVRVRDRQTFIDVDLAVVDAALLVLNAASFNEQPLRASMSERTRRSERATTS